MSLTRSTRSSGAPGNAGQHLCIYIQFDTSEDLGLRPQLTAALLSATAFYALCQEALATCMAQRLAQTTSIARHHLATGLCSICR